MHQKEDTVRRNHTWFGDEREEKGPDTTGMKEAGVNSVFLGKADLGGNPVTTEGAGNPDWAPGAGDQ